MPNERSEFERLLSEAPEAPSQDTVTLVGVLARTQDKGRFVLTLADGQSFTLSVDTVKSAKSLASAIGQTFVQLELDAKQVPEKLMEIAAAARFAKFPPWDPTIPRFDHPYVPKVKYDETVANAEVPRAFAAPASQEFYTVPATDYTIAWVDQQHTVVWLDSPHTLPNFDHGTVPTIDYGTPPTIDYEQVKVVGDPPGGTIQETIGQPGLGGDPEAFAPFVAAMPHQASPATIAALIQAFPYGGSGHTTWYADRPKLPASDGTIPLPRPPYHTFDY
jgi:hypothetical protein